MPFSYEYARPALTVDCVIFGLGADADELQVLLIRRDLDPFKGKWALPGGFVRVEESLDDAARRELREEAGVSDVYLEQLYTFGAVKRELQEWTVEGVVSPARTHGYEGGHHQLWRVGHWRLMGHGRRFSVVGHAQPRHRAGRQFH